MTTNGHAAVPDTLMAAVAAATQAPSVHNTQPWHFHIADDRIELLADFTRQLKVLDPTGRQLLISCGAALHHLKVALRGAGYDAVVQLLPEAATESLATVLVQAGKPPTAHELAAVAAIQERHSQREPFTNQRVTHQALAELRRAAEAEGAWLAVLADRDDQITLAVLLSHADQAELRDPDYQAELHSWRQTEPSNDGIPDSAIPAAGANRHSEVTIRDFAAGDAKPSQETPPPSDTVQQPDERPALVILGTDKDGPEQWLKAGQALSCLLLRATALGLRASMLGQVIDLPGTRAQLRTLLRFVGEPQIVLRLGYGPSAASTPRRQLTEVLR